MSTGPTPPADGGQNARLSTESPKAYYVSTFIGLMVIASLIVAWLYLTLPNGETTEPVPTTSIAP